MTPTNKLEDETRAEIDQKLVAAGWVVQDKNRINLFESLGVAVREMDTGPLPTSRMVDHKPLAGAEQLVGDHQRTDRIVTGASTGVADDMGITLDQAGELGRVQPREFYSSYCLP